MKETRMNIPDDKLSPKIINRRNIYRYIDSQKNVTIQEIVQSLHLSNPTVVQNIKELQARDLLCISGTREKTGGRNAQTYSCNYSKKTAIGLDISAHHIRAVLIDLSGKPIAIEKHIEAFSLTPSYFAKLNEVIEGIIEKSGIDRDSVLGVGIAVPGLVSNDNSVVTYGKILNFTGTTNREFGQYINYPVKLFNDANAGALAEVSLSNHIHNAFYISLSNNVGGAVVLNDNLYLGENERSGEIGHITIEPFGPQCYCGQKGCFETYGNARVLSDMTDGNLEEYFSQLRLGNQAAIQLWKKYVTYLAIAINNIRMLFDCNIILGGYVGSYIQEFMQPLLNEVEKRNLFGDKPEKFIFPCRYKVEAIAAGSALPFITEYQSQSLLY